MSLPSWNDTPTKQTILDYVAAVTAEGGPDYVPPVEWIAADFSYLCKVRLKRITLSKNEWKQK